MLKFFIFTISILILPNYLHASDMCDPVTYGGAQYGPIDYYDKKNHKAQSGGSFTAGLEGENNITIVTKYHFNLDIMRLKKGQTGVHIAGDLDYTLRALPNHPMALDTISRFEILRKKSADFKARQKAMPYFADCYFQKALNIFGYNQPQTYMLWGLHKYRQKKYQEAIKYLTRAESFEFESADLAYYFGLTYFQLGKIDKAQQYSDIAYKMGYQLPGLKNMLENKE